MLSGAFRTLCTREGVDFEVAADGCWNWIRPKTKAGYPHGRAHRRYWATVYGEIPLGYHIHHVCRNTSCVNPDHLEPKEPRRHLADHRREDSHLTLELVLEIRERATTGATAKAIAEAMGLHEDAVEDIRAGRTWADVGGRIAPMPLNCAFERCGKPLPEDRRRSRMYCNHRCQQSAFAARKRAKEAIQ